MHNNIFNFLHNDCKLTSDDYLIEAVVKYIEEGKDSYIIESEHDDFDEEPPKNTKYYSMIEVEEDYPLFE